MDRLDLNYHSILIKNFKSYKLNEIELSILLLVDEFSQDPSPKISSEDFFTDYLTVDDKTISESLSRLVRLKYIEFNDKTERFTIDPIKDIIFNDIKLSFIKANRTTTINNDTKRVEVFKMFNDYFKRNLTSGEIKLIDGLLIKGYTFNEFRSAIQSQVNTSVRNIKTISSLLRKNRLESSTNDTDDVDIFDFEAVFGNDKKRKD